MNKFGLIDLWDLSRKGFECLAGAFHALPSGCLQFCFVMTKLESSGSVLSLQLLQPSVLKKIKITAYSSNLFSSTKSWAIGLSKHFQISSLFQWKWFSRTSPDPKPGQCFFSPCVQDNSNLIWEVFLPTWWFPFIFQYIWTPTTISY